MREQIKQDIDLIEILFYLKKKIRVILFIMAICMAMVLLFLYINKDNIKVIYSLKINQTTPGILVSCDSNNNFACQTTMTEDVIQPTPMSGSVRSIFVVSRRLNRLESPATKQMGNSSPLLLWMVIMRTKSAFSSNVSASP